MPKTLVRTALVTSVSQAAAGTTRGTIDVSAVDGGIVTLRIINGATGPTVQCVANVMLAHKGASIPAAASEGTADLDWKVLYSIGGGISANGNARGNYAFGPAVAYLEVEFTGNTAQPVTVEAHVTTFVY